MVGGLAQTVLLNVCDAPKAQAGESALLAPTCPFGRSQTPHPGVCASLERRGWKLIRESCFLTNEPGML